MLHVLIAWLESSPFGFLLQPAVLGALGVGSVIMALGSLAAAPLIVARLPQDWLVQPRPPAPAVVPPGNRLRHLAWVALRNLLGVVLLLAGIAMLVLPGQGLLTMLVGVLCLDVPGKYRFERWLVGRPLVLRGVDALRARAGAPPLDRPAEPGTKASS